MTTMSDIPVVAIVGRPNVGKSTLFNLIVRRLVSIVEETPGVTRDRVVRQVSWDQYTFELIDTGGIGVVDDERLSVQIEKQIQVGIDLADIIIFVVDVQTGISEVEAKIARQLHVRDKKVLVVANKADRPGYDEGRFDFMELGFGEPLVISAKGKRNISEFRERLIEFFSEYTVLLDDVPQEDTRPHIAIIGRRNVGKSSLVNALAHEERVIVSDIPGTTRDPIDVSVQKNGREYVLVDTAGLMKKRQRKDIDFYGSVRTERQIGRSDGVLLVIDALQGVGRVDKVVADQITRKYKPCVIVVNKWDLSENVSTEEYTIYISKQLPGLHYAPVVYMSAKEHMHIWSGLNVIMTLIEQARTEITTGVLNRIVQDAVKRRKPSSKKNRRPKIYYAVQDGSAPPSFRIFCNDPKLIPANYRRYLANQIRTHTSLDEIPLKIRFLSRKPE